MFYFFIWRRGAENAEESALLPYFPASPAPLREKNTRFHDTVSEDDVKKWFSCLKHSRSTIGLILLRSCTVFLPKLPNRYFPFFLQSDSQVCRYADWCIVSPLWRMCKVNNGRFRRGHVYVKDDIYEESTFYHYWTIRCPCAIALPVRTK